MGTENLKVKNIGTKYYLELIGDLDEDTRFVNLHMPDATEVIVNFDKVTRIQSCGIREWIQLINPYTKLPFVYVKCPKIIIDQINMLSGFLPESGKIESFYVPYYNEESGDEKQILFTYGTEFDKNGIYPPKEVKDSNGNLMEMDVVETKYFKFLQNQKYAA
jgi:hypothetical protein